MCVEVMNDAKVKKQVVAYKLFRLDSRKRVIGLCMGAGHGGKYGNSYQVGKKYKTGRPGFQAFKTKADAKLGMKDFTKTVIRKVTLYNAQFGVIRRMSINSNGRPGWTALAMKVGAE